MDKDQLQYLVELIDDEQQEVREEILKKLSNYGYNLENDLQTYSNLLDKNRLNLIKPIIEENRRNQFYKNWISIFFVKNKKEKIEKALSLIAKFQYGLENNFETSNLLDELAREFFIYFPFGDEVDLAKFLFQDKGITGDKNDYYNPLNSNVVYTIKNRRGIPLTLALIYMLVGYRLDMKIEGCNLPTHFFAKINIDDEIILVDCFNGGKLIYETDILKTGNVSEKFAASFLHEDADAETIIKRILNNLLNAYKSKKEKENESLFKKILEEFTLSYTDSKR